jgi:hypothetical protein
MSIFDYIDGIHADSGKTFRVEKDIIITPFFTKEYCDEIVTFCKNYRDFFKNTGDYGDAYPNYSLGFQMIGDMVYYNYIKHFSERIIPIINETYLWDRNIQGFFYPFINRFEEGAQTSMPLHNERSTVSIVVKLNDDFVGGGLNFPRQEFNTKDLEVGTAIFFPGCVTHPHFVEKIDSGERYTMVGFTFPPTWQKNNALSLSEFQRLQDSF